MPLLSHIENPAIHSLEQQLEPKIQALQAQMARLKQALDHLRVQIPLHFKLDEQKLITLTEVPKDGQTLFNASQLKLVVDKILSLDFNAIQNISLSALPIKMMADEDKKTLTFCYDEESNYTPMAQEYFKQVGEILSLYFTINALHQTYHELLTVPFVDVGIEVDFHEGALNQGRQLTHLHEAQALQEGFFASRQRRFDISQHVITLSHSLEEQLEDFRQKNQETLSSLTTYHALIESSLQKAYAAHQNASWLWVVADSSWQVLLKTLSSALFANDWTYSTQEGTLTVDPSHMPKVLGEVVDFCFEAEQVLPPLKTLISNQADEINTANLATLRSLAIKNKVSLAQATTFFDKPQEVRESSIYGLMYQALKSSPL